MNEEGTRFDTIVSIRIGAEWIAIETGEQAIRLLRGDWPKRDGPSYQRAMANCEAFLSSEGSMDAAVATLLVAAMEAGMPFEQHEDQFAFLAAQMARVSEEDVRSQMTESSDVSDV